MRDPRKEKLIDLGADVLADALLELAGHSDEASALIERLLATAKEEVQQFKKTLLSLRNSRHFIDWRSASSFARELKRLLKDVKNAVEDPLTGIEMVAAFYEADNVILDMCDDSRETSAMFSVMMPKKCLWIMRHVAQTKRK